MVYKDTGRKHTNEAISIKEKNIDSNDKQPPKHLNIKATSVEL